MTTWPNSRQTWIVYEEVGINWWRTPAESPDMNPIENLWNELKWHIGTNVKPTTKEELVTAIKEFFNNLTPERCCRYIDHVVKTVIPKVISLGGKATGMWIKPNNKTALLGATKSKKMSWPNALFRLVVFASRSRKQSNVNVQRNVCVCYTPNHWKEKKEKNQTNKHWIQLLRVWVNLWNKFKINQVHFNLFYCYKPSTQLTKVKFPSC